MMAFSGKVPVTFKVDMEGVDTSKGVFVTGDFENMSGKSRTLNPMVPEGDHIFQYTTYMSPGSDGAFFFLNDTIKTSRETIPPVCAGDSGTDRRYNIPLNSTGKILAFIWESCDSIPQYTLSTNVFGQGSTSPTKGIYSQGVQVAVTAAPALGWQFNGWLGDTISSIESDTDHHEF